MLHLNEFRTKRVYLCWSVSIWVLIVSMLVCGTLLKWEVAAFRCESPDERLEFAKQFVTEMQHRQSCDHDAQEHLSDTYAKLEAYFEQHNVNHHCREVAKMFHPDMFMGVRHNRQTFSDVDRHILSHTYIALYGHCKTIEHENTVAITIQHSQTSNQTKYPPFTFYASASASASAEADSNRARTTANINSSKKDTFRAQPLHLNELAFVQLEYVGKDRDFDGIVTSVNCERLHPYRPISKHSPPHWICTDTTLPDFLTLKVVHLNCEDDYKDRLLVAGVRCSLKYDIEYASVLDYLIFADTIYYPLVTFFSVLFAQGITVLFAVNHKTH